MPRNIFVKNVRRFTAKLRVTNRRNIEQEKPHMKLRVVLTGLLVLFAFSHAIAYTFEYYAIIDNFGKRARSAYVDVTTDTSVATGPVDVQFNVYNSNGGQVALFTVTTNANGFASTAAMGNLLDLAPPPLLVRAQSPGPGSAT